MRSYRYDFDIENVRIYVYCNVMPANGALQQKHVVETGTYRYILPEFYNVVFMSRAIVYVLLSLWPKFTFRLRHNKYSVMYLTLYKLRTRYFVYKQ